MGLKTFRQLGVRAVNNVVNSKLDCFNRSYSGYHDVRDLPSYTPNKCNQRFPKQKYENRFGTAQFEDAKPYIPDRVLPVREEMSPRQTFYEEEQCAPEPANIREKKLCRDVCKTSPDPACRFCYPCSPTIETKKPIVLRPKKAMECHYQNRALKQIVCDKNPTPKQYEPCRDESEPFCCPWMIKSKKEIKAFCDEARQCLLERERRKTKRVMMEHEKKIKFGGKKCRPEWKQPLSAFSAPTLSSRQYSKKAADNNAPVDFSLDSNKIVDDEEPIETPQAKPPTTETWTTYVLNKMGLRKDKTATTPETNEKKAQLTAVSVLPPFILNDLQKPRNTSFSSRNQKKSQRQTKNKHLMLTDITLALQPLERRKFVKSVQTLECLKPPPLNNPISARRQVRAIRQIIQDRQSLEIHQRRLD